MTGMPGSQDKQSKWIIPIKITQDTRKISNTYRHIKIELVDYIYIYIEWIDL